MTQVEAMMKKSLHRDFVIKQMVNRMCNEIKDYIRSREEDRHYADSWEQSSQIGKDIDRQREKLNKLKTMNVSTLSLADIAILKRLKKQLLW